MINPKTFFDIQNLKKGSKTIIDCIERQYEFSQVRKVDPEVTPGFLRKVIQQSPPEEGTQVQSIVNVIQKEILPGHFQYHSPKYFGHFSLTVSDTSILAEMIASAFHTPGSLYFFSPSYTELENIMVDWAAQSIKLPEKFMFKGTGGGIINPSATDGLFTVVNAAKVRKMNQLGIWTDNALVTKFVGYYSQFCHKSAQKALVLKDIPYRRSVPCFYNQNSKNFQVDAQVFQNLIKEDIQKGLIPFIFMGTYGSTLTSAIDLNFEIIDIAKKHDLWLSADAVYLGPSMICQQNLPAPGFFEKFDSVLINFSKHLLVGNGGAILFIGDRKQFSQAINKKLDASYYQNTYTGNENAIDYGDWIAGFDRRQNFFKFYFLFKYYGMKKLRTLVKLMEHKANYFRSLVESEPDLFQIFTHKFSLVTLRVKDPITKKPSNELTQKVIDEVKNHHNGYSTPGQLNEYIFIRLNFGSLLTQQSDILTYFQQIKKTAIQVHNRCRLSKTQDA